MPFPEIPFKLSGESGDGDLVRYLKGEGKLAFLQLSTVESIQNLNDSNLRLQHDALIKLWPQILQDAIRELKLLDEREYNASETERQSFFHKGSLGVTELSEVLSVFAEFESMQYGAAPEKYRDHVAHVFRNWIMGYGLLQKHLEWNLRSVAEFEDAIGKIEWTCMWTIAALCHDIGYPLETIGRINQRAGTALDGLGLVQSSGIRFGFSQQMLPFHDTIIKLMSSEPVRLSPRTVGQLGLVSPAHVGRTADPRRYVTHLQNKYYLKYLKSFDALNHGIVSAMLLSKTLVYFLESDLSHDFFKPLSFNDARQFLIRREILRAVASHTCADIYHLRFDTLSFMLYFIDEIQCWGRPTFKDLHSDPDQFRDPDLQVEQFTDDSISVKILLPSGTGLTEVQKWIDNQFDRLHRILRLSVGTLHVPATLRLSFSFRDTDGNETSFRLADGQISVE